MSRLHTSRRAHALRLAALLSLLAGVSACDRVKSALNPQPRDQVWQRDSALLARGGNVFFRVVRDNGRTQAVPIALVGSRFEPLSFSNRGWRAFDIDQMHSNSRLVPYVDGRAQAPITVTRGMWEGAPLDTLAGCTVLVPGAAVPVGDNVQFLTTRPLEAPKATSLSSGELQKAMDAIALLVAPTANVPIASLPKYRRNTYVVPTGTSPKPSIVMVFDDPTPVVDTLNPIAERPRQFVAVLDQGVYDYKPTYTYSTVGNRRSPPKLRFLGSLDVNGDGTAELLFGVNDKTYPLVTFVFSWMSERWKETARYDKARCHG
jgi:hypothetical protein